MFLQEHLYVPMCMYGWYDLNRLRRFCRLGVGRNTPL